MEDGDDSKKDYIYNGNYQDLQPLFNRQGKYRMVGNLSQIQYAAGLRNYHPILDSDRLKESIKVNKKLKKISSARNGGDKKDKEEGKVDEYEYYDDQ